MSLLYERDAWTLNAATVKKLESFEVWVYRRIIKISWTHRRNTWETM